MRLGKGHTDVATSLNNLGGLYQRTGHYAKAESSFRRALGIYEAQPGKDHVLVALALTNLGCLLTSMGEYAKAEPLLRRALGIQASRGKDRPDVATSLNHLAVLHQRMGQYAKAEPLFLRSLEIRETKLGKDRLEVGETLNNLAELYSQTQQYAKAEPLYLRSLEITKARQGEDHPNVATVLTNLAGLYKDMKQYARAEPLYLRGLEVEAKRLGKDHPAVATTLNNLAGLYDRMGQTARAEPLYRRSLKIFETRLPGDHPLVVTSLTNLAHTFGELGQTGAAAQLFDRARRASRRHVSVVLPSLPPAEQAAFLAVHERREFARALSLPLGQPGDPGLTERSAAWLLNGKAVAEEALARSTLLARDSRDPAVGKLAAQLRERRAELARLSLVTPPKGQEKERRQRLEELASQEQQLARQLAAAGGASVAAAGWIDPGALRKRLHAGDAFLDVACFDRFDFKEPFDKRWKPAHYVAWVTPARGDVRVIDLGDAAAIDAAIQDVRRALEGSAKLIRGKGEAEAEKALREPLEKLSGLVLKPLLPHVGEAKRWVVSPDANLWLIPWEILLLAYGSYAVEKHLLSYVVSGRDLVLESAYKGKPSPPVLLADPDFDLGGNAAGAGAAGLLRLGAVKRLPGTRGEARAIERPLAAYAKQAPAQYLGKEALEGVVKGAKNPRALVLATHGFFLPTGRVKPSERAGDKAPVGWENPLLRCGLLLAGCNAAKATGDDGVLTGLEVVGMDLRGTELVVLSACETGLGDVQNGEGVAGLRQAFRLAGAESVVSTLWQVPDKPSAKLMTLFFHNLAKGRGRADALRDAQLKLIEERRDDTAAAHPYFWAAFTLTGR